jgi:hypothetical protein
MGATFLEVQRPEREADYSSTVMWRLGVKGATLPLPQYALMPHIEINVLCLKKPVINHLKDTYWFFVMYVQHQWISNVNLSYFIKNIYITIVVTVIMYYTITLLYSIGIVKSGSLSLCHGASSGCGWRMALNMEGNCEYIE